jgi:3-(3-hydroxy-phenyl)propionate hydroxylase
MNQILDVAIVGAGPVGLALGNILGMRGLSVGIFERQSAPYGLPRAVHLDAEAMRSLQATGLAQEIAASTIVGKGMLFQNMAGETLVDWSRSQSLGPLGWYESNRIHQPYIEEILLGGLDRFPHVSTKFDATLAKIFQSNRSAKLAFSDGQSVEAKWVVGCDGASSTVRDLCEISLEDLRFNERWLVADFQISGEAADRGRYTIQFCDPDIPATYVCGVGNRRRWEVRLGENEPGPVNDDAMWQRLSGWISADDAKLERFANYTFRAAVAEDWRRGRVFLAGDAAHQMPPFMGQGLCAGFRDVANLGWKLAAAVHAGNHAILDSYQSERAPNVRQFIENSVQLGRLINQTASSQAPSAQMKSPWPSLGPGLGSRDDVAGHHAPQPDWEDDQSAHGFYVQAVHHMACDLPVFTGLSAWLEVRGLYAIIVRPDGIVWATACTSRELEEAVAEVLLSIFGTKKRKG